MNRRPTTRGATWAELAAARPDIAAVGRRLLYSFDIGLGFLATVRADGGPRVHPICPLLTESGLYGMIIPGPKLDDLRRDPRYALHGETYPTAPPGRRLLRHRHRGRGLRSDAVAAAGGPDAGRALTDQPVAWLRGCLVTSSYLVKPPLGTPEPTG